MENIKVIDSFLDNEELKTAMNKILDMKWSFGHKSLYDNAYETPFWSCALEHDEFFSVYIKQVIEKTFSKRFEIIRLYANGQTYGQDGIFHVDCENKSNKYFTFCLYLSNIKPEYIEIAGGHIYFKFPDLKYNICYEPVFNRGIFFPSGYEHKACAFSRYIMNMRVCVSWKLKEI
jgi:hypothetical protein